MPYIKERFEALKEEFLRTDTYTDTQVLRPDEKHALEKDLPDIIERPSDEEWLKAALKASKARKIADTYRTPVAPQQTAAPSHAAGRGLRRSPASETMPEVKESTRFLDRFRKKHEPSDDQSKPRAL